MERYEEARAFVVEYHANGDETHPIVDLEMDEMRASMREQGILSWRNFFDLRMLFKSPSRRYRMMLNVAMSWFGQFSGTCFVYAPPFVAEQAVLDKSIENSSGLNSFQVTILHHIICHCLLQTLE